MLVRWTEGREHGLVWGHGLAVLSAEVDAAAARRLWTDFADGGDLAAFLKLLSAGTGVDVLSLPEFAIALRAQHGGWHLAARGSLEARAGDVSVRGQGISTWAERFVATTGALAVGQASATGEERPIVAGLVPAAALAWDGSADAFVGLADESVKPATPTPAEGQAPAPAPQPSAPRLPAAPPVAPVALIRPLVPARTPDAPAPAEPVASPASPESPHAPESVADGSAAVADGETIAPDAEPPADQPPADQAPATQPPATEPRGESAHEAVPPQGEADESFGPPIGAGRFARQFGETQVLSVEAAAVREPAEDAFISGVPKPKPVADPASAGGDADAGDHDGHTVMMSDEAAPGDFARSTPEPDEDADGPEVLGVLCANGHANPPQRSACTTCGAELVGEARRLPRPSLGTVMLPSGERIELTGPVIIGRNPRADRVQGSAVPRLVPLSQGHVSGTHLELRLEDWNVLAVDLHSTNGTFLRRSGEAPVRLGERPELLIAGDVLDLGHGVQVVVEQLR